MSALFADLRQSVKTREFCYLLGRDIAVFHLGQIMTFGPSRLLPAVCLTFGLASTAAMAGPLADTPENREKVVSGVMSIFSSRGISPNEIEQTQLCQVTVGRKLMIDFTQLDGLVQLGLSNSFGNGKHVAVTGQPSKGGNSPFVCAAEVPGILVWGAGQCDSKIEADDVSASAWRTMSAGVEKIKQVCNP